MISPTLISASDDNKTGDKIVIPGGEAFGIKIFSNGLIVTKTEEFETNNGFICPAKKAGIETNDIIVSANKENLNTSEDLKEIIDKSNGNKIELKILRNEKELNTTLVPVKNKHGNYKAGIWIKDSAAGLGTISFYCTETESFCGLGHGICDADTGCIIPLSSGDIEKAIITSVTKSTNGNVGTLNGIFSMEDIGTAEINCDTGIYGKVKNIPADKKAIEIAPKDDVKKGNAQIITTIDENEAEKYNVKIKRIRKSSEESNMIIEITDERLLKKAGGIVQGMSGSPIIQNGKLVGVITHVFVDDVTEGYAIFAETMYDNITKLY